MHRAGSGAPSTGSAVLSVAASGTPGRRRLRRALLALVALLYVLSIPWYRTAGDDPTVWLGLPGWVAVALLCYVGAAFANAAAWLLTDVPDAPEVPEPRDAPAGSGVADAGSGSGPPGGGRRR